MPACIDRPVVITVACPRGQRAACQCIIVTFTKDVGQRGVGGAPSAGESQIAVDIAPSPLKGEPCLVHRRRGVGQTLPVAGAFDRGAVDAHT